MANSGSGHQHQPHHSAATIVNRLQRYHMLDWTGTSVAVGRRNCLPPAADCDGPGGGRENGAGTWGGFVPTASAEDCDASVYPNPWVRRCGPDSSRGQVMEMRILASGDCRGRDESGTGKQPRRISGRLDARSVGGNPVELQDLLGVQQASREVVKDAAKTLSFLQIVRISFIKYCQTTSLRGVPKVVKTKEKLLKGIWATFVLAFFLGCLSCLGLIVSQYLAFDVIHQPRTIRNFPVQFPSFTVCNTRPLSQEGIEYIRDHKLVLPKEFSQRLTQSAFNTIANMAFINETFNQTIKDALSTIFDTKGYYENMPPDIDRTQFGHTLDETILLCESTILIKDFKRSMFCDRIGNWTRTYDNKFLNCYTFTAHANHTEQILTMRIMGYTNERNLTYCPDCSSFPATQVSGLRVQLHNAGNYPEVQEEGLNLKPGSLTEIRFETKQWMMKEPPHGYCSHKVPPLMQFSDSRFTYSYQACKKKFLHEQIYQQCGCLDSAIPLPDTLSRPGRIYCGRIPESQFSLVRNSTSLASSQSEAVAKFYGVQEGSARTPSFLYNEDFRDFLRRVTCNMEIFKAAGHVTSSQCFTPCKFYTYETTISTTDWPTRAYLYEVVNEFQLLRQRIDKMFEKGTTNRNSSYLDPIYSKLQAIYDPVYALAKEDSAMAEKRLKEIDYIQSNFIEILINRGKSNFDIEQIEEKAVISLTSLLSQIGGLLSIWIGLTFVCIVEIIELLYNIVTMCSTGGKFPDG